jgi:predicted nucleic acid-binding protein
VIVVDTNVVAALVLRGRDYEAARSLLRRDDDWSAPRLWRSEFLNLLSTLLRSEQLDLDAAVDLAREAEDRLAEREYSVPSAIVLRLAAESGCTAYDCEFVAVARELGVRLVTQDAQVLKAFPKVAVRLT